MSFEVLEERVLQDEQAEALASESDETDESSSSSDSSTSSDEDCLLRKFEPVSRAWLRRASSIYSLQ